jgi:cation transport protein ChaC
MDRVPPDDRHAPEAGDPAPRHLTREMLLDGGLADIIAATTPGARVLTDAERHASIDAILAERPEHGAGLWVFAYGSLLWNPIVDMVGRRPVSVAGWHRAFCLRTRAGRGTPKQPGLLLGLRRGGACEGAVLRLAEAGLEIELDVLWRREMVTAAYTPRWVEMTDGAGAPIGHAVAFTIDATSPNYVDLPEPEVVRTLAVARGPLGTCAEYLFRTRDGLGRLGIHDQALERIAEQVTQLLAPGGQAAPAT